MTNALYVDIKNIINSGSWQNAFVEKMGWGSGQNTEVVTQADDKNWKGHVVARLKGFSVIKFDVQDLPDNQTLRNIDKALFRQFAERLTIISSPAATAWLWPRKRASGFLAPEIYTHETGRLPDYLAQKLSAISFSVKEHTRGFTLGDVRDRVRGQFDTSKVTKKFYEDFKKQHESLTKAIQGLPESEAHSYSSLLLNRLMFIYFLQKKEFINGDPNYLRNCLTRLQALNTDVKFYSFYKDLLQVLFFNGLNKKPHEFSDPAIAEILGNPPYVNGGIFGANELEQRGGIEIPDSAFEEIFRLFDSYTWHLDTSPTGNQNEINPEVIGYIFEQYINYTANGRRESGAYYTPQDVCAFMAKSSIVPLLAEKLETIEPALYSHLMNDPAAYLNMEMLHGWNFTEKKWLEMPEGIHALYDSGPANWNELDLRETDGSVCLPGESWVETFHRRERVLEVREALREKPITSADDLVSYPIDGIRLIVDFLENLASKATLEKFWQELLQISIIDPTCGSGAFLFAALEVLEDIYHAVVSGLERTKRSTLIESHLGSIFGQSRGKEKYVIRKLIAQCNLYGTDLMEDAIETAKLRLFLSLVATLDKNIELDPLPDLDFNLKCANLVIGYYDPADSNRVSNNIWAQSNLDDLSEQISEFKKLHQDFIEANRQREFADLSIKKQKLLDVTKSLRESANTIYADSTDVPPKSIEKWVSEHKPFHWFIEFPEVVARGGFDVIIGNPPYISMTQLDLEERRGLIGYTTTNCSDFYAVCYERSLQLLSPSGRHAMIIMSNLAFGSKFGSLRKLIDSTGRSEFWSTYGVRPDSLFAGILVRNTILILGNGDNKYSTHHNTFTKKNRTSLFSCINYRPIFRTEEQTPLRGGVANDIVSKISSSLRPSQQLSGNSIVCTRSAKYWYSVLPMAVPALLSDNNPEQTPNNLYKPIRLLQSEPVNLALALLGGKLAYLWWSATGDDFNSGPRYGEQVLGLLHLAAADSELLEAAEEVFEASKGEYFISTYASKKFINLKWSALRKTTDRFDQCILKLIGLEDEWKNLNIWYRQVMKSSGDNLSSSKIPWSEVERLGKWYAKEFI